MTDLLKYLDSDKYRKDSIICLIMMFNPLLDHGELDTLDYDELETLCESERLAYNARLKSNEEVSEQIKKG